jgi:hypothetical protein
MDATKKERMKPRDYLEDGSTERRGAVKGSSDAKTRDIVGITLA